MRRFDDMMNSGPPSPLYPLRLGPVGPAPLRGLTRLGRVVRIFIEPEGDRRSLDENGPLDQIWLLGHEVDGFLLRPGQRPLFEDRAALADEIKKTLFVNMSLEKLARWRRLVDVALLDLYAEFVQISPGIPAGRAGRLPVKRRLDHLRILS